MPAVDFQDDAVARDVVLNADEIAFARAVEDYQMETAEAESVKGE